MFGQNAGRAVERLAGDRRVGAVYRDYIGEGVKRLPAELRDSYRTVPWKEIAGTRDHLSHGYDDVDYQVFWDAVNIGVPVLLATIERMLIDLDGHPHE